MAARVVRAALVSLLGCGASEADGDDSALDAVSLAESSLAVCEGDDSSSVAAALAVAAANELGRWDALSDFQLVNGRLQLSPNGERRCEGWPHDSPGGCENIRAVLALQQDTTAMVPGHDPASLRGKLSAWYKSEQSVLSASRTQKDREPRDAVLPGMYALAIRHSGRYMAVAGGQVQGSALVQQQNYESWDDRYHWYINHGSAGAAYEVVNRRSGMCLDLETPSNPTTGLVQQRCSGAPTQRFTFRATADGRYLMLTVYGKAVEIPSASRFAGARFAQGSSASSAAHRQLSLSPIVAGEPHVLTFSNVTGDGPCGDYYWYDITQPNGQPLREPAVAFEQLIFAGGKTSPTAADPNPFLAQQAGGHRVAIAPAYGLNAMPETSAEACSPACLEFSLQSISGQCCSCNGETRTYRRSAWSSTTYLCQ